MKVFILFWTKYYIDLTLNCIDKLQVLQWILIVLLSLVAGLFLFCYEGDLMLSLSDNNQDDVFGVLNSVLKYLHDLLNIDNIYFK